MTVTQGLAEQCMNDSTTMESVRNFQRARRKARFETLSAKIKLRRDKLLCLADVRRLVKSTGEHYGGIKSIPVDRIVGSESRSGDFTASFLPKSAELRHRWERINTAIFEGVELPPISVIEIGGVYFVRDGNHRVSVARSQKTSSCLDAEITHIQSDIFLEPGMSAGEIGELMNPRPNEYRLG